MTKAQGIVAVVILTVLATGCDIQKKTDKMLDTSDEILDNSKHLSKRTDDLEAELVKKEASVTMDEYLDVVFGENSKAQSGMALTESDQAVAAGKAIQSMLFQYWKGDYNEDIQFLDARVSLVAKSFFPRLIKHVPRDFNVDVLIPSMSYTGVGALGAMMDEMDPRYESVLRKLNMPPLSFYEIVMEALRGRMTLERKELLPVGSQRILEYADEAMYMVQVRHNFLPLLALCRMTDFQDRSFLWNKDLGRLGVRIFGIDGDLSKKSPAAIMEWKRYLELALKTRKDLRAMGVKPQINGMMAGIFQGLNFGQAKWISMDPAKLSPEDNLRREFALVYRDLVMDNLVSQSEPQN